LTCRSDSQGEVRLLTISVVRPDGLLNVDEPREAELQTTETEDNWPPGVELDHKANDVAGWLDQTNSALLLLSAVFFGVVLCLLNTEASGAWGVVRWLLLLVFLCAATATAGSLGWRCYVENESCREAPLSAMDETLLPGQLSQPFLQVGFSSLNPRRLSRQAGHEYSRLSQQEEDNV